MPNLSEIAASLRDRAIAHPGISQAETLKGGAVVSLRLEPIAEDEIEWHLQIKRDGKLPDADAPAYKRWLQELATFRKPEYFNVPAACEARMQAGARTYAAVMVWVERVDLSAELKALAPVPAQPSASLPATPEEIAAWAQTLGPGVNVRHVNVMTGE